jgi:O-antigen ligase
VSINLLNNKYLDKSNIAFVCILGMFAGFLVSPAVLSISMFLYGVSALRDVHPRKWIKQKWWLLGLVWIAFYAISYFWSDDKGQWGVALQVKLPFLILPLAFAYTPEFSPRRLQLITLLIGLLLLSGALYSISFLVRDPEHYILQYNFSHLLPTPCRQDHISFSIAIALYIVRVVYVWPSLPDRTMKVLLGIVVGLLVIYIHVLAAKSGLVALYLFLGLWSLYLVFTRMRVVGVLLVVAIPLFYMLAAKYIPTLDIRRNYMVYSMIMFQFGDKSGNYGDVNRLMAYDIAVKKIKEHPVKGVGAGDIMTEMKSGYHQFYPQVREEDVLIPHNQFLIVAVSCGIPAMIVFAVWFFMPLTWLRRNRQSFFFFITWLILLMQLSIDTALEAQMCIFVFVFYLLQQKQSLTAEREVPRVISN